MPCGGKKKKKKQAIIQPSDLKGQLATKDLASIAKSFLLYLAVIFSVLLVVVCFTEIKSGTFNRPSCAEPGEPQTHRANGARRPINWSN